MTEPNKRAQAGVSIIECLIASVILVTGLVAVIGLMIRAVQMETYVRDQNLANASVRAKVEELKNLPPSHPQRQVGGSLTSDVADYNDTVPSAPGFTRRWTVAPGPVPGTQTVTVTVVATDASIRLPTASPVQLATILR
jgi:Tfp pilus assembly protein PilV